MYGEIKIIKDHSKNMKYTIRIPTSQYAYIETEYETEDSIEAIQFHNQLQKEYTASLTTKELDSKEWNAVLDRYLSENKISSDLYDRLSNDERIILNEIKKSFARISKTTSTS